MALCARSAAAGRYRLSPKNNADDVREEKKKKREQHPKRQLINFPSPPPSQLLPLLLPLDPTRPTPKLCLLGASSSSKPRAQKLRKLSN